ncbi:MAG: N-acetylmuramoyl-L-alanine amidase [Thermoanaerobaculia bacterium]|nr:N-acetylmuramoyl-L-alanine amidase [Thermoanaerobaculia bacterium]
MMSGIGGGDARLKRRLLSGAVEDNVRAIENRPVGRLHRRKPFPCVLAFAGVVVVAAAALVVLPRFGRGPFAEPAPGATVPSVRPGDVGGGGPESAPIPRPSRLPGLVFPVEVQRIVVDPGHGGGDEGSKTPAGLAEKEITLDISRRLADRLRRAGYEATLTRETDQRVLLKDRSRFANERQADLFVSIHINSFQDGRVNRGIETYYLGPSDDPYLIRLAGAENVESGYSMADVKRLLESVYSDFRQEQSRALATSVQRRLVRSVRELAPEVVDRGVKSAPFLVLVSTDMPAILAEISCLSNQEEALLLAQPDYRDRLAQALFEGIQSYSHSVRKGG